MTERDDSGRQSGYVVLPGGLGNRFIEGYVYRRCFACGGYFRTDDLAINIDHRGCQGEKAPGEPITYERRRR
jgi:hypothetical protein